MQKTGVQQTNSFIFKSKYTGTKVTQERLPGDSAEFSEIEDQNASLKGDSREEKVTAEKIPKEPTEFIEIEEKNASLEGERREEKVTAERILEEPADFIEIEENNPCAKKIPSGHGDIANFEIVVKWSS